MPKMPKCSLYGRSALLENKDSLKSRKIPSYYIKGPKSPICIIVIAFSSLFVVSNPLKFQKLLDSKLSENFLKKFNSDIAKIIVEEICEQQPKFKACQENIKFEP